MDADAGAHEYGDSYFLAERDKTVHDFRTSDKDTKRKIIGKMLTLRHNMKYNKHLLSVYMKAKSLFDTMIEEHRSQLHSLDEIYRHLNHIIRENLSAQKGRNSKNAGTNPMMAELVKDKKRIGALLKKMRDSFNKLMDIDTVIGVTIAQINEITFMEDHVDADTKDADDEGEAEDEDDESDDEDDDDESDSEPEADEDDESDSEPEADEADEDDEDDESDSEPEAEDEGDVDEDGAEDEDEDNDNEPIDEDDESDSEPEDDSESGESESEDADLQNSIYLF
jgi:hypothetical protein